LKPIEALSGDQVEVLLGVAIRPVSIASPHVSRVVGAQHREADRQLLADGLGMPPGRSP
jgi:hypothetical protein